MATPFCPQEVQAGVIRLVCHRPVDPQESQLTHPATFNLPQEEPFPVQRYLCLNATQSQIQQSQIKQKWPEHLNIQEEPNLPISSIQNLLKVETRRGSRADIPTFGVLGDDIDPRSPRTPSRWAGEVQLPSRDDIGDWQAGSGWGLRVSKEFLAELSRLLCLLLLQHFLLHLVVILHLLPHRPHCL